MKEYEAGCTSSDDENKCYNYQLISFPGYEDENGKKAVDIVLASLIYYNKKAKKYFTKFPPPPYDTNTKKQLKQFLRSFSPALDAWPEYEIQFQGYALINFIQKLENKELFRIFFFCYIYVYYMILIVIHFTKTF